MNVNHSPLGYDPRGNRDFNNLQDADAIEKPITEISLGILLVIGLLTRPAAFVPTGRSAVALLAVSRSPNP
jgi:uncharacterized membrane protein YphA (DoxX/SURF4 family)